MTLAKVIDAITLASQELLRLWPGSVEASISQKTTATLGVQTKQDGSLVSQADFISNKILTAALHEIFPGFAMISEEGIEELAGEARGVSASALDGVWIIDPLDGTSSFLHGRDDFSVLAGAWCSNGPLVGIMNFPARKKLVVARVGEGCTVNGERVAVSTSERVRPGAVYVRNFTPTRSEVACSPRDSGCAFMQVATGELDGAVIHMTAHKVWDVAAPLVAILEAGGKVSDENGAPIDCAPKQLSAISSFDFPYRYVVTSNGRCHHEVLSLIQK